MIHAAEGSLRQWRQLLEMEGKYGPLPGTQHKLPMLIRKLKEKVNNIYTFYYIKFNQFFTKTFSANPSASQERQVLYDLLSSEGSIEAQKVYNMIIILHNLKCL